MDRLGTAAAVEQAPPPAYATRAARAASPRIRLQL